MEPKDVGFGETKLVLGKHSGRHALSSRLKKLGFTLKDNDLKKAFEKFKTLADKKKNIYDEDLKALVENEISSVSEIYKLKHFHIEAATDGVPKATVTIRIKNKEYKATATGDGPVDACYKAIDKITGLKGKLKDYNIRSITSGKDALGEASIKLTVKEKIVTGIGTSTDVIEASIKAYLNAMDKISWMNPAKIRQCL